MNSWKTGELEARSPVVLASRDDARAVALRLRAGESLTEHEVHERAWLTVIEGTVEVSSGGESERGGPGLLVEFSPRERHQVDAHTDARMILMLTPWPGEGHPGTVADEDRTTVRTRAAERAPNPTGD